MAESKEIKIGAVYSRVSDDESASKDLGSKENQVHIGLETARDLTRKFGVEHRIEYRLVEDKGKSGGNTNRPQYKILWNLISLQKIDFITAKELSRLNRSMKDFIELMEHCKSNGVQIHIPGLDVDVNTPTGDYFFKQLGLMAELERNFTVSRTKTGIRTSRINESKITGGRILLGFDPIPNRPGFWKANKKELVLVDRILDVVVAHATFKGACDQLRKESITSKYGSYFRSDSLIRLVFSRKYEGILEFKDGDKLIQRKLEFGAVVNLEKLQRARNQIKEFQAKFSTKTRVKNRTYLLTGLLQYEDGTPFMGMSGTSKTGDKYYYYWNKEHKVNVVAENIENIVLGTITCYTADKELQQYVKKAIGQINTEVDRIDAEVSRHKNSLKRLEAEERKMRDQIMETSSEVVRESFEDGLIKVRNDIKELRGTIPKTECERDALKRNHPSVKDMKGLLRYVMENFGKVDASKQRHFFRQVFEKIVLCEGNKLKLYWKFDSRGLGGNEFVLGTKWGG